MMQQHRSNSYLFGGNAPYVEELYEAYLDNPGSVPDNWRTYFDNLQHVPATDGSEAREIVLQMRVGDPRRFLGQAYLTQYVLPNFYFHATTAYALLRHAGVEIGKRDFIG